METIDWEGPGYYMKGHADVWVKLDERDAVFVSEENFTAHYASEDAFKYGIPYTPELLHRHVDELVLKAERHGARSNSENRIDMLVARNNLEHLIRDKTGGLI